MVLPDLFGRLDIPGLTANFGACYPLPMRFPSSVVWAFLLCSLIPLASCSTARPVPTPARVAPPVTPTSVQTPSIPGPPVALAPEDKALGHFLKSQVALNAGDYDTALSELEHAVSHDPHTPFLRLRLATLALRQGKLAEALEHCQQVVASEPDNVTAQRLLAGLLSSTGKENEAAQVYESLLTHGSDDQEPYLYLSVLYTKQDRFQEAIGVLKRLVSRHPQSVLGYYYLGQTHAAASTLR